MNVENAGLQGSAPPPDVEWFFDEKEEVECILDSMSDWHDALSMVSDLDHIEAELPRLSQDGQGVHSTGKNACSCRPSFYALYLWACL